MDNCGELRTEGGSELRDQGDVKMEKDEARELGILYFIFIFVSVVMLLAWLVFVFALYICRTKQDHMCVILVGLGTGNK